MAYPTEWMSLNDATARVVAEAECSDCQARTDICQAIADGAIRVRAKLKKHTTRHMTSKESLQAQDLDIPSKLKPTDMDWEGSRPLEPWLVRRGRWFSPAGYWELARIELSRTDVRNVLCARERCGSTRRALSGLGRRSPSLSSSPSLRALNSQANRNRSGSAAITRPRGPRPTKFERTKAAMTADIQQGRRTVRQLTDMIEKVLAGIYGVSRDTARKARAAVLSEFGED
jgi:hypothetical protein